MNNKQKVLLIIMIIVAICSNFVFAEEKNNQSRTDNSKIIEIAQFFKQHIIGKTLVSPESTDLIDNGEIEVVSRFIHNFNNFNETREDVKEGNVINGFSYDIIVKRKQTNYKLNSEGKRIKPSMNKDVEKRHTCYFNESTSTGEVFGQCIRLKEDGSVLNIEKPGGSKIKLENEKLFMSGAVLFYVDTYSAKSKSGYTPATYDIDTEFSLLPNGKLEEKIAVLMFYVDPSSMTKTQWEINPAPITLTEE